jgi:hypothetical protein
MKRNFWCVETQFSDMGRVRVKMFCREREKKPADGEYTDPSCMVYSNWYETEAEAKLAKKEKKWEVM